MSRSRSKGDDPDGCWACFGLVLVIGLVVGAAISLASLVDPFSWMPPVDEVWADCSDDYATDVEECDLATRFPGFWGHVVANLVWAACAVLGILTSLGAAFALREERPARFDDAAAAERYAGARTTFTLCAGATALVAALPIVVAAL